MNSEEIPRGRPASGGGSEGSGAAATSPPPPGFPVATHGRRRREAEAEEEKSRAALARHGPRQASAEGQAPFGPAASPASGLAALLSPQPPAPQDYAAGLPGGLRRGRQAAEEQEEAEEEGSGIPLLALSARRRRLGGSVAGCPPSTRGAPLRQARLKDLRPGIGAPAAADIPGASLGVRAPFFLPPAVGRGRRS